jgi:hypothetical protein
MLAALFIALPALASAQATLVVDKTSSTGIGSSMDNAWVAGQLTFDASYPTGGEALVASTVETAIQTAGFTNGQCNGLERVIVANGNVTTTLYNLTWDDENGKVMAFVGSTGAEVANAVDLALLEVEILIICSL